MQRNPASIDRLHPTHRIAHTRNCTSPPIGSQVIPKFCSSRISRHHSTCSFETALCRHQYPAALEHATPTSPGSAHTFRAADRAFSLYENSQCAGSPSKNRQQSTASSAHRPQLSCNTSRPPRNNLPRSIRRRCPHCRQSVLLIHRHRVHIHTINRARADSPSRSRINFFSPAEAPAAAHLILMAKSLRSATPVPYNPHHPPNPLHIIAISDSVCPLLSFSSANFPAIHASAAVFNHSAALVKGI